MATLKAYRGSNAVIFAATGEIAGAVARELAGRGARLFLSGRDMGALRALAEDIAAAIGVEAEVGRYGQPSEKLTSAVFLRPLDRIVGLQFLTATRSAAIPETRTIVLSSAACAASLGVPPEEFSRPAPGCAARSPFTLAAAARSIA